MFDDTGGYPSYDFSGILNLSFYFPYFPIFLEQYSGLFLMIWAIAAQQMWVSVKNESGSRVPFRTACVTVSLLSTIFPIQAAITNLEIPPPFSNKGMASRRRKKAFAADGQESRFQAHLTSTVILTLIHDMIRTIFEVLESLDISWYILIYLNISWDI